jgi:hypothetical protein
MRSMTNMRRTAVLVASSLLLLSLAASAGAARVGLGLEPAVGPPTSLVRAKGSGFAAGEVVPLFFDGGRVGSVVASRTG